MPNEAFIIINVLFFFLIGMLGFSLYLSISDWYSPRFSPMGPWPSKAEQHSQNKLDASAQYKEEIQGLVKVKNYRWNQEKRLNNMNGIPNTIDMPHIIKFRKDKENQNWFPYQEKLGEYGSWGYIGSCKYRIEN